MSEVNVTEVISVPIRDYPNYRILSNGLVINAITGKVVRGEHKSGYIHATIRNENGPRTFDVHRLVMDHFGPPKPEVNFEVDHIDHDRGNNNIENLRWVTRSDNLKNRTSSCGVTYEFFDEIPADDNDIIEVRDYVDHEFEDLYYHDDSFYFYNGIKYRRLHINHTKSGSAFVNAYDTNNKRTAIYYSKFKKLYGLI